MLLVFDVARISSLLQGKGNFLTKVNLTRREVSLETKTRQSANLQSLIGPPYCVNFPNSFFVSCERRTDRFAQSATNTHEISKTHAHTHTPHIRTYSGLHKTHAHRHTHLTPVLRSRRNVERCSWETFFKKKNLSTVAWRRLLRRLFKMPSVTRYYILPCWITNLFWADLRTAFEKLCLELHQPSKHRKCTTLTRVAPWVHQCCTSLESTDHKSNSGVDVVWLAGGGGHTAFTFLCPTLQWMLYDWGGRVTEHLLFKSAKNKKATPEKRVVHNLIWWNFARIILTYFKKKIFFWWCWVWRLILGGGGG